MRNYLISIFCILGSVCGAAASCASDDIHTVVVRVQKRSPDVQLGMTKLRVIELLGEPEEVRKRSDGQSELLCYGGWRVGAFPAIGVVKLDETGRVIFARYSRNLNAQKSDSQMRTVFRLIDEIDSCITDKCDGFNPLAAIRVRLLASEVGLVDARAALTDYVHLSDGLRGRTAWYAAGYSARSMFRVGKSSPWPPMLAAPTDAELIPDQLRSFPITVVNGIPIVIAERYGISTGYGTGQAFAEHATKNASLVESVESPGSPTEAFEIAFAEFRKLADPWRDKTSKCFRTRLLRQFVCLIGENYQDDIDFDRLVEPEATAVWNRTFDKVRLLQLKWDKSELKYVASNVK